ncbi:MAG: hypothetical protein B7Z80_11460 [Rhodospirillales bacterium 20-64-7]|nr:MAG: hypothetical protein B7Z80_11460 [Rhodospirillales bacterium 20-64-7]
MILQGLWLLARGQRAGIKQFGNSYDAFTASLAPLIAFPLVGGVLSVLSGDWQSGIIGFLARFCAVLALPLIVHAFARRTGREALWLRTATALDWSFWLLVPMLFIAAVAGAVLVELGLPMTLAEQAAFALIAAYLLWLHWFIMRCGLELRVAPALLLVALSSFAIGVLTMGPVLIDLATGGHLHG